eukprot:scaffold42574_cov65-Attheya_sp.AAC.5
MNSEAHTEFLSSPNHVLPNVSYAARGGGGISYVTPVAMCQKPSNVTEDPFASLINNLSEAIVQALQPSTLIKYHGIKRWYEEKFGHKFDSKPPNEVIKNIMECILSDINTDPLSPEQQNLCNSHLSKINGVMASQTAGICSYESNEEGKGLREICWLGRDNNTIPDYELQLIQQLVSSYNTVDLEENRRKLNFDHCFKKLTGPGLYYNCYLEIALGVYMGREELKIDGDRFETAELLREKLFTATRESTAHNRGVIQFAHDVTDKEENEFNEEFNHKDSKVSRIQFPAFVHTSWKASGLSALAVLYFLLGAGTVP